ncbi:DUF3383 family protein [Arsenophonus endosymbiont of Crataerina pallida]|uniref:DUF3383 family protein n=1 Tax=Arsenophonus endosymbiont of Crataerina pallida TaxID=3066235 RepID=UPI0030CDAE14
MSNNLGIDIENVVNVQLLKEQRGANYDNINHVIMMTSETGTIFDGKTIYATYKNIAGVKADFSITSKTYQMATAFFGTSPNPIGSGGSLIIGHWRKTDLTLPAVAFDTLTGSVIDSNESLKALRQIEDGSMTLGELTLENLNFGDAVTFGDVIDTLNRSLPDGYPSAENQPNDSNVPTTGKSTFTHQDKRFVVSGKGLAKASEVGTGTFIGNLLGLGDSAVLTKATPSQTLPAQSPEEAIADVVAASSGCGYCFIDELTNDQILKLANYSQANKILGYQVVSHPDNLTTKGLAWQVSKKGQEYFRLLFSKRNQKALAVSYMARVHVVDFSAENSAMTIHLKELACEPESYTQTEVDSASSVGIDIYTLIKDRPVVMCSNANEFVDNVYNLKAYVNQVQVDTFNLMKSTATKIPQTEKGVDLLVDCINQVAARFVRASVFAAGKWTSPDTFGDVEQFKRSIESKGYFTYANLLAEQSQVDRTNRKSPTIQQAVKNAGAFHRADIIINFNY